MASTAENRWPGEEEEVVVSGGPIGRRQMDWEKDVRTDRQSTQTDTRIHTCTHTNRRTHTHTHSQTDTSQCSGSRSIDRVNGGIAHHSWFELTAQSSDGTGRADHPGPRRCAAGREMSSSSSSSRLAVKERPPTGKPDRRRHRR